MKTLTIGRHESCDIILDNGKKAVSRKHAILTIFPDGNCTLEDIGSTNHTYVNGKPLRPNTPYYLYEGDEVSIAGKVFLDWGQYRNQFAAGGRHTQRLRDGTAPMEGRQTRFREEDYKSVPPKPEHQQEPRRSTKRKPRSVKPEASAERKSPPYWEKEKELTEHPRRDTVLTYTAVGDFFDKVIPIPALSKNIRLFFNLHVRPITKILQLIEQPDAKAEAHPFGFLGFALIVYLGITVYATSIFSGYEDVKQALIEGFKEGGYHVDNPSLMTIYFAVVVFIIAWVTYSIFKRVTPSPKSFTKFLKMTCLSQGMVLIYVALAFLAFMVVMKKLVVSNGEFTDAVTIASILLILTLFIFLYFVIVNIRVNRRFWDIGWGKFIFYFIIVSLISGIISNLLTWAINGLMTI